MVIRPWRIGCTADGGWPFRALALELGSLDGVFGGNGKINGEVGNLIGQLIK